MTALLQFCCGFSFLAGLVTDDAALKGRESTFSSGRDREGRHRTRCRTPSALVLCLLTVMPFSASRATEPQFNIDIPAMNAAEALNHLAEQTGSVMLFSYDLARAREANAVRGRYTLLDGLELLLRDSGLSGGLSEKRVVIIAEEGNMPAGKGDTMKRRGLFAAIIAALAGGASADVNADQATEAEARPTRLEEVKVTATKREQRVQDIPMSMTVISNQDIERRGLIGMEDYLRSIPGVNQVDEGPAKNAIVIRGVTVTPGSENFSTGPTVATYFDETSITGAASLQAGGIDVRPVDMQRIEVLRGPQGTTFGSSSLSGTLRLIPMKPQLNELSARVAASYSDTSGFGSGNSMIQGIVNLPVVADKFALRLVGYRYDESGTYRNSAGVDPATIATAEGFGFGDMVRGHVQDDVGALLSTGARLGALWQITDKLNLTANFVKQKLEQDGAPQATIGAYEQARMPSAPDARIRGEIGEVADTEMDLANLVLTHGSAWGTLTSVVSRVESGFAGARQLFPFATSSWRPGDNDFSSLSVETRFASGFEGPFQFLAGLYYEDIDEGFLQSVHWHLAPAPSPLVTNPVSVSERTRDTEQRAMFGEVSYGLTDKLTVVVGGRYFEYDKEENILRREGGLFGVPIGGTIPSTLAISATDTVFKANINYKPTQDSLLYAAWSEGFRLGRGDVGAIPALCDIDNDGIVDGTSSTIESTRRISSDFLENYEVGAKFALFDRRMVVDVAAYHIDWYGLPIRFFPGTCTTGFFGNVGKATSNGAELQVSLYVAEGLRFDFGAGYTDAELAEDSPGLPGSPKKGTRLPGAAKLSASLGAQYDFDIAGYRAFVRADSFYAGKFSGALVGTPGSIPAGDYVKIDARAGVAIKSVDLELFVRNLTNDDAFTWRGAGTPLEPFPGFQLRPRTVGIQLSYSFE